MNTPTQRQIMLKAKRIRSTDPWPRSEGHVVLAVPGSPREQKGYHEPGGSFSPAPGSFGLSIWVVSPEGNRLATSDDIPLTSIKQQFQWPEDNTPPSLVTETPYYQCSWSIQKNGFSHCDLQTHAENRSVIWVRSVGPAGGPLESLSWNGRQLNLNRRWIVEFENRGVSVWLGDEDQRDWATAYNTCDRWESLSGWGCARIEFADPSNIRLRIHDTAPTYHGEISWSKVKSTLQVELPDDSFMASLDAQVAHLLMSFMGNQTCPGEPTNYPLTWERDGAYAVIAMARSGQIETAKELAIYFAENDFFGGFGAEGDAPGSTINVLASIAMIADDIEFTKWAWPHIQRKVTLIQDMLAAKAPIQKDWLGPIVPEHLNKECIPTICLAGENGLIMGSMDLHYPVLYINAFSHRGLLQAAKIAEILGEQAVSKQYTDIAQKIRQAWMANFKNESYSNERTYMSGIWPTWMVGPDYKPFSDDLQVRWEQEHKKGEYPERPLWTYFTAAEAHQWLFLDRPDNVWCTMRYFWNNQCSPGLYTYWEGNREENTFGLWEHIRGWENPKHVTPHYWTAAEMLLLQLDMLAYISEAGSEPVLVIGGGIPLEWMSHPMKVKGLPTSIGVIDWSWQKGRLEVTIHGKTKCAVRAGVNFDENTDIVVTYEFGKTPQPR